jgi:hypothetical protein
MKPLLMALVIAAAVGLVACVEEGRPDDDACSAPAVEIELTLDADSLTPNDPAVCGGQAVTLVIDSAVDGIIHIHGYDEWVPATEVQADEELRLTFDAERTGQFPIELHPADDPAGVGIGVFTVHEP